MGIQTVRSSSLLHRLETWGFSPQKIREIAKETLLELSLSLGVALAIRFTAVLLTGSSFLFSAILAQLVTSLSLRILGVLLEGTRFESAARFAPPLAFTACTALSGQMILHEWGHIVAAALLYRNTRPVIFTKGFLSGQSHYTTTELSPIGRLFGKRTSNALISAGGPALTLTLSGILFSLGLKIQKEDPKLSRHLIIASVTDFLFHSAYALLALLGPSRTNDFYRLARVGLHPIGAALTILAIPLLLYRTHTPL